MPAAFMLLMFLGISGTATILGWVAAAKIRKSDGQLHGMGFALAGGLPLPGLLFLVTIGVAAYFAIIYELWLGIALLLTLLFLGYKFMHILFRSMRGTKSALGIFAGKINMFLITALVGIWALAGALTYYQRPQVLEKATRSTSPSGIHVVSVVTWRRDILFSPDKVGYTFTISDNGGDTIKTWQVDAPNLLEKATTSEADFHFSKQGTIKWAEGKSPLSKVANKDNETAYFNINEYSLFTIDTSPIWGQNWRGKRW